MNISNPRTTSHDEGCIPLCSSSGDLFEFRTAKNVINGRGGAPDLSHIVLFFYAEDIKRHHFPYFDELANWSGQIPQSVSPKVSSNVTFLKLFPLRIWIFPFLCPLACLVIVYPPRCFRRGINLCYYNPFHWP